MSSDFRRFLALCLIVGAPFAYCHHHQIPAKRVLRVEPGPDLRTCIRSDLGLEFESTSERSGRRTREKQKIYVVGTISNVSDTETVSKVVVQVDFALGNDYKVMQPNVLRHCRTQFEFGPLAPGATIDVEECVGSRPVPRQALHHRVYVTSVE